MTTTASARKEQVRRLWRVLWSADAGDAIGELVAPEVRFRGTLGDLKTGLDGVSEYVARVQDAFPDFGAEIDQLIEEHDQIAARMTLSGTHRGEIFGIPPNGRKISYPAVAIHRFENGRITSIWVVGDTRLLEAQIRGEA